jgi:hypothetical protein
MTYLPPSAGPPPGWHADPWMPGGRRWWDGNAWSAYAVPPPAAVGTLAPTPPTTAEIAAARRWSGHAANAFLATAAIGVIYALVTPILASNFVDVLRDASNTNSETADLSGFNPLPWFALSLLSFVSIGALIVLCMWTYHATKVAAGLGRPLSQQPILLALGWVIPVLNYFFPYLAMRDLVPEEDPVRPLLLTWWLCYVLGGLTILLPSLAALFSLGVGLVVAVIPIAVEVVTCVLGRRIARAVGATFNDPAPRPDATPAAA